MKKVSGRKKKLRLLVLIRRTGENNVTGATCLNMHSTYYPSALLRGRKPLRVGVAGM
jgi:hypothetical protein